MRQRRGSQRTAAGQREDGSGTEAGQLFPPRFPLSPALWRGVVEGSCPCAPAADRPWGLKMGGLLLGDGGREA